MYDPILNSRDNLTILDIGGNIGLFSLFAQDSAKVIYTLEPTPSHYSILTELTSAYSNIHALPIALHNQDSEIDFYVSTDNSTMNSSVNQYGIKISVNARTLASIIQATGLDHVDFVKCDIEGSEMAAITDETVAAVKNIVDTWFVEVHATDHSIPWAEALEKNRQHIADIFRRQGYTVSEYRIDGLYVTRS
jgi:FkbM family methyltransferase